MEPWERQAPISKRRIDVINRATLNGFARDVAAGDDVTRARCWLVSARTVVAANDVLIAD